MKFESADKGTNNTTVKNVHLSWKNKKKEEGEEVTNLYIRYIRGKKEISSVNNIERREIQAQKAMS